MDYKDAGVDVEAGRDFVKRISSLVEATRRPEVMSGLRGFSGLCGLPKGYRDPVLVSGTDGVGTKLKIAQALNCHSSIGIDLVAMCVNDVLTCGAEPLFFLDYLATGKLEPDQLMQVVDGISQGCRQANCALLGGETAEMPGFYSVGEYDLAGFCVGVVERDAIVDGKQAVYGDVVVGLASSGVHSNGYSLVRKVIAEAVRPDGARRGYDWSETPAGLGGKTTLGETLLRPTEIYVGPVLQARKTGFEIHGMAHITGGGLPENLPRCLGNGQAVRLECDRWPIPEIFGWLAQAGDISPAAMFKTYNMGIGFTLVVPKAQAHNLVSWLSSKHVAAYIIGEIVPGAGEVLGLPQ